MKNLKLCLLLCIVFTCSIAGKSYSRPHLPVVHKNSCLQNTLIKTANSPLSTQTLRADLYVMNDDSSISLEDGTLEIYNTSYCDCVNWLEDAKKLTNFLENLAIARDGQLLAIEKRQPIGSADTVFYNMTQMRQRSYDLLFTAANLNQPNLFGFIQDSYTGTSTAINLNGTTLVPFTITSDPATANPNRFRVVFTTISLLSGVVPVTYTSAKAWQENKNIDVQWQVDNQLNVSQYRVEKSSDGVHFSNAANVQVSGKSTSTYSWEDIDPSAGNNFYRIKEINYNGEVEYSKILKVSTAATGNSISVYPNPVVSGVIGLQMDNMASGTYSIRLLNTFGQLIYSKSINHMQGSATETITAPSGINKGVYRLEVIRPDNSINNINVVF